MIGWFVTDKKDGNDEQPRIALNGILRRAQKKA